MRWSRTDTVADLDGQPDVARSAMDRSSGLERDDWLPLADAARRLNTSVDALRKQVKRGRREGRRDNRGQWLVKAVQADTAPRPDGQRARSGRTRRTDTLAVELATVRAELSMSRAEVADLRAERDRLLALAEMLAAGRRWRWPGVRALWEKFLNGAGAGSG